MADGRVMVVHGTGSVRAHLAELLTREGYRVESVDSTYRCMARFVDDPAELVVIGLAGLADVELGLIASLREEDPQPRILAIFPPSLREMAARALALGADTYLLEPFYPSELQRVAASLMRTASAAVRVGAPPPAAGTAPDALQRLAHEVAHAISNPLQIVRLLLDKKGVTKKDIEEGVPPQLERIAQVIDLLREFGGAAQGQPRRVEAGPPAQRAAKATGVELRITGSTWARVDEANYTAALTALFQAVRQRVGSGAALLAQQHGDGGEVVVQLRVAADAFDGEELDALDNAVFVVGPERDILPGLALARMLLEESGGRLEIDQANAEVTFRASVPSA